MMGRGKLLKRWLKKTLELNFLDNPGRIVPTAMNLGIQKAKGEYIVRMIVIRIFAQNILKNVLKLWPDRGMECGEDTVIRPGRWYKNGKSHFGGFKRSFWSGQFWISNGGLEEKEVDTVPFGTYRKDIFDKNWLLRCPLGSKSGYWTQLQDTKSRRKNYYFARHKTVLLQSFHL